MDYEGFVDIFDGTIIIVVERYNRMSSGPIMTIGYQSTVNSIHHVLGAISEKHAYGFDPDQVQATDKDTALEMLKNINNGNGDGCDWIFAMKTGGVTFILDEECQLEPSNNVKLLNADKIVAEEMARYID